MTSLKSEVMHGHARAEDVEVLHVILDGLYERLLFASYIRSVSCNITFGIVP